MNLLFRTDSYKVGHWKMLPKGANYLYSYLESRGGLFDKVIFFGLYPILKNYLSKGFTQEDIKEAHDFYLKHFGRDLFNTKGWESILNKYNGKIPLIIKAVPEGSLVPVKNVLMDMSCDEFPWLVNYFEGLLQKVWYPTTIATNSYQSKLLIKKYLEETQGNIDSLPFKLHDFGYRGVSTEEQAEIGGMAHLLSFSGSDNIPSVIAAKDLYNEPMAGFSVPASEHSIETFFGENEEKEYILTMLREFPEGTMSCVLDGYNIYNAAKRLSEDPEIKEEILKRNGTFVLRPDSGNPLEVLDKIFDILWQGFGGTYNDKHYKVLDNHIRVIQGDGIDYKMIGQICEMLKTKGFSTDNIVFGSGGGLLQKFDRDTQKFAIKASYGEINGKGVNLYKNPITSSMKSSKKGKLKLIRAYKNTFTTISSSDTDSFNSYVNSLETVFENGEIKKKYTFQEIRDRLNSF